MILASPLLKQELATECANMENAMLTVQGAPWTWVSAWSESESQHKKRFMLQGLSSYEHVYHFMNLLVPDYLRALPCDTRTGGPFSILETDSRLIIHSQRLNVGDPDGWDDWQSVNGIALWEERTPATTPALFLSMP